MRILALTRYSSSGPSSRVRFYQYFPYLKSRGVNLQVAPLLNDDYVRNLFSGRRQSLISLANAYIERVSCLIKRGSFDLLWLEKELFPWLPIWIESSFVKRGIPFVADYDDAVFHRYHLHHSPMIRALLGNKIDDIMRYAATVVVGNDYLADHARLAGADRVEILPSVVDITRYSITKRAGDQFRIGWIGSPVTAPYLELIRSALEETSRQINSRIVLVGAGNKDPLPGLEKEVLPWSEEKEVDLIQTFDVGIMPLTDGPFEEGKCGYKLIQYMSCGLPVVASPVGVNMRIVESNKTGFLASSTAEWVQALVLLSKESKIRTKLGEAGRKKVEEDYSLQVTAPRLLDILTDSASR